MNVLRYLDRLPPFVCRLIARDPQAKRRPLTIAEIGSRAGLPPGHARHVLKKTTWADVKVETALRLRAACGIDERKEWRQIFYLKRALRTQRALHPLAHLDRFPTPKQKIGLQPFLRLLEAQQRKRQCQPKKPSPSSDT